LKFKNKKVFISNAKAVLAFTVDSVKEDKINDSLLAYQGICLSILKIIEILIMVGKY
jgi:hypothetical protein